jgi:SpoVK/Ycf46/Vps4 family AAA+-type ATPase
MKPDKDPAASAARVAALPDWYPPWARELAELYFSETTSVFVLHGNVFDQVRGGDGDDDRYTNLSGFLAEQVFGSWDIVLHYDLAGGLRALAGRNQERLRDMVALAAKRLGDLADVPRDPAKVIAFLDRAVQRNLMAKDDDRLSIAIVIEHASYVVPAGEPGHLNLSTATNVVSILNQATSPYVKRLNMAFVLVDAKQSAMNDRLTGNPHVAAIEVAQPDRKQRLDFVRSVTRGFDLAAVSDYGHEQIAELTAGISLSDIQTLVHTAREVGRRLDSSLFRALKKRLIERQAEGLLEFVEPKWNLDMVVGHDAAKERLRDDAELLKRGRLDCVPMGYLLCGPVGTGKTFLAQCATGSMGVPCVVLKNFRSKYVGETEGNLERVLAVLRAMGPVVVIVDEADAMLGDRDQGGDSGTSSRVFAMIAAQMGDTRYRGRIVWMLLTCRPDLLPIDLKRQGRAEVHIPMFYPHDDVEIRSLFVVLGKKLGARLAPEDVPAVPHRGDLSGADIEGIVGRALRRSLLAGHDHVTKDALAEAVEQFMPSTQSLERELQEIAATIECTDRQFLPPHVLERLERTGGRPKLQERLTAIARLVDRG